MELLDSYLKAVKPYLPRGQRNDIIAELSEELRWQMESREAELGRPRGDTEQMALFKEQGDPMIVAPRYRQSGHRLTMGWELIGPELFLCQGTIACVNAFRPQWNRRRAVIRGIVNALSLLVVCSLLAIWFTGGRLLRSLPQAFPCGNHRRSNLDYFWMVSDASDLGRCKLCRESLPRCETSHRQAADP